MTHIDDILPDLLASYQAAVMDVLIMKAIAAAQRIQRKTHLPLRWSRMQFIPETKPPNCRRKGKAKTAPGTTEILHGQRKEWSQDSDSTTQKQPSRHAGYARKRKTRPQSGNPTVRYR